MSASQTLEDEVLSLNSIYGDDSLVISKVSSDDAGTEGSEGVLRLPSHPSITLRVFFPATYAEDPPAVLGTQSVGDDLPKGAGQAAVSVARRVLERTFSPGQPCLFDVAEELGESLTAEFEKLHIGSSAHDSDEIERLQDGCVSRDDGQPAAESKMEEALGPAPDWTVGVPITEKKSVFLARCTSVASVDQAQQSIAHLLATDKRAAKATHNISAWRIRAHSSSGAEVTYQDFDEDGETAAGGRVLRLLQLMDVWDVVVVVSRWFGGVLLGPARFAIINEAAREVVTAWQEEHGVARKGRAETKAVKKAKR